MSNLSCTSDGNTSANIHTLARSHSTSPPPLAGIGKTLNPEYKFNAVAAPYATELLNLQVRELPLLRGAGRRNRRCTFQRISGSLTGTCCCLKAPETQKIQTTKHQLSCSKWTCWCVRVWVLGVFQSLYGCSAFLSDVLSYIILGAANTDEPQFPTRH